MTIKILMPALSPTMTEGNLTKWMVKIGDDVKAGDTLAEIETDKATMEVEAVDEGRVTKILFSDGSLSVPVNSTIAILNGSDEKDEIIESKEKENFNVDKINDDVKFIKNENINNTNINYDNESNLDKTYNQNLKASPYVKKLAKNKNIDLSNVEGSGPEGRIIKRDVEGINLKKVNSILGK